MGLASAQNTPHAPPQLLTTPQQQLQLTTPGKNNTPVTPTPNNFLDALRRNAPATGLKEHERLVEDLKKETFDLKLKCYNLEDQLRKCAPANVQLVFADNESLRASNEALSAELKSLKVLLADAQNGIAMAKRETSYSADQDAEIERLRQELVLTTTQLNRTIAQTKNYEQQLDLYDNESRESLRKQKQLEMEVSLLTKKLADNARTIEAQRTEIGELQEELRMKNAFVQQVKAESHGAHGELEMLMRQKQELESRLRIAENERDVLKNEHDPARRRVVENLYGSPSVVAPGSPRSSMDLLESRLLRQMGTTSKQLEMLTKSNALTQSEKDQLQSQMRNMLTEVQVATRTALLVFDKIANVTNLKPAATNEQQGVSLERIMEELLKMIELVLEEFDAMRRDGNRLASDLREAHEQLATMKHTSEKLRDQVRVAQEQLSLVEQDNEACRVQFEKRENELVMTVKQLKSVSDIDLPRYREQCVSLQNAIGTLEQQLTQRTERLAEAKAEQEALKRKASELETECARVVADRLVGQEEVARLRRQGHEMESRLAAQEDLVQEASKKLEQVKHQLTLSERAKVVMQETFERELKSLHSSSGDLKGQLTTALAGRNANDARLERLQATLRILEDNNKELAQRVQAKDSAHATLIREHELGQIERETLARELAATQESLQHCEAELNKLKRADLGHRRGMDGIEHLQAKLDNLQSLNSLLKEQLDAKERQIRDCEDRLRKQEESIRRAYADCDTQSQKIKKRELVISRVLKRLENINAIAGLSEDGLLTTAAMGGTDQADPAERF